MEKKVLYYPLESTTVGLLTTLKRPSQPHCFQLVVDIAFEQFQAAQ